MCLKEGFFIRVEDHVLSAHVDTHYHHRHLPPYFVHLILFISFPPGELGREGQEAEEAWLY